MVYLMSHVKHLTFSCPLVASDREETLSRYLRKTSYFIVHLKTISNKTIQNNE